MPKSSETKNSFLMSDKLNVKTYEKNTTDYFKKHWFSDIKNSSDLVFFQGDALPSQVVSHSKFLPIIRYIAELFENANPYGEGHTPKDTVDEVYHFEQNGQLCVYLSVLNYILFMEYGIADEKSMKYVQGYYHHESRKDNWMVSMLGKEHVGSHAWLLINKGIVDISIKQEEMFFKFEGYPAILGEVPAGLLLKGFTEPKKTVNKYVEQFAKRRKLTKEAWIAYHKEQLEQLEQKE